MSDTMNHKSPSEAGSSPSSRLGKSRKPSVASLESHGTKEDLSPLDERSASATQARTAAVQKVLEGLRADAFELARDIGAEVSMQPGGLRNFFPRASEEPHELVRAGQKPGAPARQSSEFMSSQSSRRRRWWKLLQTLYKSIELSEPT